MSALFPAHRFGALLTPQAAGFRVFAPSAVEAWVVVYEGPTGPAGRAEFPLNHLGAGTWEAQLPGEWEGRYYTFRFAGVGHEERTEVIDPWAVNAVDAGRRARLTVPARTDPPGWERGRVGPALSSPTDAIICECHVRDLTISTTSGVTRRGGYLGWCESGTTVPGTKAGRQDGDPTESPAWSQGGAAVATAVDHLVELGITHVQLLPVQDFDGEEVPDRYFWGYMTSACFSPEGMFSSDPMGDARLRELKHLIQALHLRGLGVVLDVVLNHAGRTSSFDAIAPGYYFRHWPDGSRANGSGCGNDFRSESEQGRRFIIECLKFWVREYGVDGFRIDLMALLDRETMVRAETELRALRPDILLYGEPWSAGASPIDGQPTDKRALAGTSIGAFNDEFRDAVKGPPNGAARGFIQQGWNRDAVLAGLLGQPSWAPHPAQAIQYMTCHDNLCLYDKLVISRPDASDAARARMAGLGYFLLLLAQGVPFLHGGDEFFRTKQGDANSYQSPDTINQIDWRRKAEFMALFRRVSDLIALRKAHPLFRLRTREEVAARCCLHPHPWGDTVVLEIDGRGLPNEPWRRALLVVNGSPDAECEFEALPPGRWRTGLGDCFLHQGKLRLPCQTGVVLCEE